MVEYKGMDKVDAQALSVQRSLTEALWLTLQSQGGQDFSKCRMLLRRPRGLCGRSAAEGHSRNSRLEPRSLPY